MGKGESFAYPLQDSPASESACTGRQGSVAPVYCVLWVSVPLCLQLEHLSPARAVPVYKEASAEGSLKARLSFSIFYETALTSILTGSWWRALVARAAALVVVTLTQTPHRVAWVGARQSRWSRRHSTGNLQTSYISHSDPLGGCSGWNEMRDQLRL